MMTQMIHHISKERRHIFSSTYGPRPAVMLILVRTDERPNLVLRYTFPQRGSTFFTPKYLGSVQLDN